MSNLKYRILIIDDSEEDRDMYRLQLCEDQSFTYEFDGSEMAEEGLAKVLNEHFDCLILDYGLPDSDGITFLKKLNDLRPDGHAPVVMVTGQGNENVAVEALRHGAEDYLVKSQITPQSIFRATTNAIEKHRNSMLLKEETANRQRVQEQLTILVEGARDHALILLDAEGNISTWNSGATTLTGYSDTQVLGKHINILYRPEDQQQRLADKELAVAKRSGKVDLERWLIKQNGEEFWATGSISLLTENERNVRGFAKIIRNDTVKKRLLEEQASREKWLETLLDSVPVAFVLFEARTGRLLFSNRTADQLVGGSFPYSESREDFLQNYPLRDNQNQLFTEATHPWLRAMNGEKLESCEVNWPLSDSVLNLLTVSEELPPLFGRDPMIILSLHNVSVLKEMQSELEGAKLGAEAAAKAKSEFLANMSHEIRTPLGVVIGFSELAARPTAKPDDRSRFVDVIKRNGKILTQLIDGILDLSKIDAGRFTLNVEALNLAAFGDDIIEVYAPQAKAKNIELTLNLGKDLPPSIQTDATRLKQIIYNLIGNAIKFTEVGGVSLTIDSVRDALNNKTSLTFTVSDTGIGISHEHVRELFKPFMQADSSITRKYGGTGLGLMLCAKLSDALGGKLELENSELGRGSQFRLTLPVEHSEEVPAPASLPGATNADITGHRILVVEDTDDAREFLIGVLKEKGADVQGVSDGSAAVTLATEAEFDAVLMDVQMSGMDGYTATRELRKLGFTRPIIGLSANVFPEDRNMGLEAGMNDYLGKPIQSADLVNRIAWHLTSTKNS